MMMTRTTQRGTKTAVRMVGRWADGFAVAAIAAEGSDVGIPATDITDEIIMGVAVVYGR